MTLGRRCRERDFEAATGVKAIRRYHGTEADLAISHARVVAAHDSHADKIYARALARIRPRTYTALVGLSKTFEISLSYYCKTSNNPS